MRYLDSVLKKHNIYVCDTRAFAEYLHVIISGCPRYARDNNYTLASLAQDFEETYFGTFETKLDAVRYWIDEHNYDGEEEEPINYEKELFWLEVIDGRLYFLLLPDYTYAAFFND